MYIFNYLSFDLSFKELNSNFCTPSRRILVLLHDVQYAIAQVVGPLLSRVTWALLKLLVSN